MQSPQNSKEAGNGRDEENRVVDVVSGYY